MKYENNIKSYREDIKNCVRYCITVLDHYKKLSKDLPVESIIDESIEHFIKNKNDV